VFRYVILKKVLWINHFVPFPPKGGLLIRTNGLLAGVGLEHKIYLLAMIQPRLFKSYFSNAQEGIEKCKKALGGIVTEQEFIPFEAENYGMGRLLPLVQSLFSVSAYSVVWLRNKQLKQRIRELLASEHFDVIHLDTMELIESLPPTNVPIVINHHNAEHEMLLRRAAKESSLLKKILFRFEALKLAKFYRKNMHKAALHLACSKEDILSLTKFSPSSRFELVPNGVPVGDTPLPSRSKKLLFVGGLDWYPNRDAIEVFLESAWPLISETIPDISLEIIGKNPSEKILQLAKKYSNVAVLGFVDDISLNYKNVLAFICPLRDGGGTKLKVIDAMANRLPVIGSDIAFEGIAVSHLENGLVANNIDEIISCINVLKSDSTSWDRISSGAYSLVKKQYDVSAIAKKYAGILQSV